MNNQNTPNNGAVIQEEEDDNLPNTFEDWERKLLRSPNQDSPSRTTRLPQYKRWFQIIFTLK